MRIYDIIQAKKCGAELSAEEIGFCVSGFTDGSIPDYQMSALLMAICLKGMNPRETKDLCLAMASSGDMVDLSAIPGVKVDKHSTGGVGDKTTLIIMPIVAALGVPIAKMSGRGLGHTGGTVDKLEAIPGLKTAFVREEFIRLVIEHGICVAGQSGNLAPADKKIYDLRDVTATIESIPLIASSVMSKKIAAGADAILLDVKTGSGAFMKTLEDARALAQTMVEIGTAAGRRVRALITDMDRPLGHCIGNSLEIIEAVDVLSGRGPADLTNLSLELAAEMLALAGHAGGLALAKEAVADGSALDKLSEMVEAQGGDPAFIRDTERFPKADVQREIHAARSGYVSGLDAECCGKASVILGAGRERAGDSIDYSAGTVIRKNTGDWVELGESLAVFHTNRPETLAPAEEMFLSGLRYSDKKPDHGPLILDRIGGKPGK